METGTSIFIRRNFGILDQIKLSILLNFNISNFITRNPAFTIRNSDLTTLNSYFLSWNSSFQYQNCVVETRNFTFITKNFDFLDQIKLSILLNVEISSFTICNPLLQIGILTYQSKIIFLSQDSSCEYKNCAFEARNSAFVLTLQLRVPIFCFRILIFNLGLMNLKLEIPHS
mgnify:CR=1 FL=1